MKSDWSKERPPDFSVEPVPSDSHVWDNSVWVHREETFGKFRFRENYQEVLTSQSEELQMIVEDHKQRLSSKCESVTEGTEGEGSQTLLNSVYTELYITEGLSKQAMTLHEEKRLEEQSKKKTSIEKSIRCHDVFKPLQGAPLQRYRPIRTVLTVGVAGVGKTFSVLKFCLDWAQGLENQDLKLVLPLSFRELNLVRDKSYSLMELIQVFYPELDSQTLTAHVLSVSKLLFIFDGLDESRLSLDFKCELIHEVTHRSKVSVLLVNLIKGSLLPNALIWITSRPAAAHQIPVECVHRVTEVRGFITDQQKEQYFRKRFTDEELFQTVMSHIKNNRSLFIMGQIPVFCWITSTVLDHMLRNHQSGALPQTLTDMFAHFLLVQIKRKRRYNTGAEAGPGTQRLTEADKELLLKLGRLAFEHLEKGNIMFYQEDLEEVGLDLSEASIYSGLCTEIFKRESVIFNQSVYCFIHLSIQEFLAAVFMHHCFLNNNDVPQKFLRDRSKSTFLRTEEKLLRRILEKSLKSPNGHLDLFVRFLHGLSLESNQTLLKGLLSPIYQSKLEQIVTNLKEMNCYEVSSDRSINILYCLAEMKDQSLLLQIQDFLKSGGVTHIKLSEIQCSALAYLLQMSEQVLEELDVGKYNTSREGKWRLVPAVMNCRKARFVNCELSEVHYECVASALKSSPSLLRELDLSFNFPSDSEVSVLCAALQSPHCELSVLRLQYCELSATSCFTLASALKSKPSHLLELNLGGNSDLSDSGVFHLCAFLQSPDCRLKSLSLWGCGLSEISCSSLASALKSNPSHLIHLSLGLNDLKESDAKELFVLKESPDYRLKRLSLE